MKEKTGNWSLPSILNQSQKYYIHMYAVLCYKSIASKYKVLRYETTYAWAEVLEQFKESSKPTKLFVLLLSIVHCCPS